MKTLTAKFFATSGMDEVEIKQCDGVIIRLSDGRSFELEFRRSDGEISLNTSGQLIIEPRASNVVRIDSTR